MGGGGKDRVHIVWYLSSLASTVSLDPDMFLASYSV